MTKGSKTPFEVGEEETMPTNGAAFVKGSFSRGQELVGTENAEVSPGDRRGDEEGDDLDSEGMCISSSLGGVPCEGEANKDGLVLLAVGLC
jgi:hypothetical protein